MTRRPSFGVLLLASFLVLFVGSGLMLAATVAVTGVARVQIEDRAEGFSLDIPVPALLIEGGALVASFALPDDELARLRVELGDVEPIVSSMLDELVALDDVVLVEVNDGSDWVRVEKRGGALVIDVEEPDTSVHLSVPLGSVRRSAGWLFG